jgi:exodeoxyribonuclease VII large subunit
MEQEQLSIYELNRQIKESLEADFPALVWVMGEISEIREDRKGHCYLDLMDRQEGAEWPRARARAIIWANAWRMVRPYFETTTGQSLETGMKILAKVSVDYHEVFGLSLNIKDIEPSFTIGEQARRRQEIIERLAKEGVMDMNKDLPMPLVPQRVAIISSEGAAGYGDFINQLENNPYDYHTYYKLYPATMQGARTEESVIKALEHVNKHIDHYDAVLIIRGGGAKADLNSFDSYWLAYHITQFPLPVISGIGHERDETIVDLVAHTRVKTPTAAAEYLIDRLAAFDYQLSKGVRHAAEEAELITQEANKELNGLLNEFMPLARLLLQERKNQLARPVEQLGYILPQTVRRERQVLNNLMKSFGSEARYLLKDGHRHIDAVQEKSITFAQHNISKEKERINMLEKIAEQADPERILRRGFSLTLHKGRALRSHEPLNIGDEIKTRLAKGTITSRITKK